MRLVIITIALLTLSGCALFGAGEDRIIPQTQEFALVAPTQPRPISTKEVELNVISKKVFMEALIKDYNMELDTAAEIAKLVFEEDVSLFTLNAKNYGNLGENMQEITRFIRQQRAVIQYYKDNVPEPVADNEEPKK